MTQREPIAIVGAGVVSPAGSTLATFETGLREASGTNAEVMAFADVGGLEVLGCRARDVDPASVFAPHELRRLDRAHQLAIIAADAALAMAGDAPPADRCAVVVGTALGAPSTVQTQFSGLLRSGVRGVLPMAVPVGMFNSVAAHLSIRYGYTGLSNTVSQACASGAVAIGEAMWLLRSGRVDRVLAGGVDAALTSGMATFFARMEAMSSRLQDPERASRPFDAGRDGFVLGEGAAFVVLERERDASAPPMGTVLGYGCTSDAHHLVAPRDDGAGAIACMRAALTDAGLEPADMGHINAHGTSTLRNDVAEAMAIAAVFGAARVPVTANKSVIGHLMGAAGAVEALSTVLSCRSGIVPPIANLTDPAVDLCLATEATPATSLIGMSNSFGFGGHNATLVLSG